MGIARQDGIAVLLRTVGQHRHQLGQLTDHPARAVAQIHADIQRHLIVAAAGGVQLFAHIPQPLGQHLLHKHVNILAGHVHSQLAALQIIQNALQAVYQPAGLLVGDNALGGQHGRVSHAAQDVLPVHAAVKMNGRVKIVRQLVRHAAGAARP